MSSLYGYTIKDNTFFKNVTLFLSSISYFISSLPIFLQSFYELTLDLGLFLFCFVSLAICLLLCSLPKCTSDNSR